MIFVDTGHPNNLGVPRAKQLPEGDEHTEKAARMAERILLFVAVLAALCLAVLIAVNDSPVNGSISEMCDHGKCQLSVCIEYLLDLWPR